MLSASYAKPNFTREFEHLTFTTVQRVHNLCYMCQHIKQVLPYVDTNVPLHSGVLNHTQKNKTKINTSCLHFKKYCITSAK